MDANGFNFQINFIKAVTTMFKIDENNVNIGVYGFGGQVQVKFFPLMYALVNSFRYAKLNLESANKKPYFDCFGGTLTYIYFTTLGNHAPDGLLHTSGDRRGTRQK